MSELSSILTLEYGEALPAESRSGHGFPVFGSNGEVGRHHTFLIPDSGIVVGRKGSVGKVTWSDEPFWPIDTTYWVYCAPEDKRWLYWVLSWLPLARLDTSTGVPGLNRNDVYELTVDRPQLRERQCIAEILDILDTTIHETEAIIAKLKAVKQGLLHDLLTRGIDANGELRPPQSEAPHLYKESALGWIPKEWDVKPIGEMADIVYGISDAIDTGIKEGIPTITLPCVSASGELTLTPENLAITAHRKVLDSMLLKRGDLLFNWRNGSLHHLGKTAYFDSDELFTHVGFLLRVRAKSEYCLSRFLCSILRYAKDTGVFLRAKGQVNNTFNSDELRNLHSAFAAIDEQQRISEKLESFEKKLDTEFMALGKLMNQKSGLMDDLLTGRVGVTPLLNDATP